ARRIYRAHVYRIEATAVIHDRSNCNPKQRKPDDGAAGATECVPGRALMALLVTGGAGYIGSHMVLALVDAGEQVVVLDDLSTGFKCAVHPKARFVQGDVADEALVLRVIATHGIDAVIHFAARIV